MTDAQQREASRQFFYKWNGKGREDEALNSIRAGFQINRDLMIKRIERDAELVKFVNSKSAQRK